jgi:hypothetical protein
LHDLRQRDPGGSGEVSTTEFLSLCRIIEDLCNCVSEAGCIPRLEIHASEPFLLNDVDKVTDPRQYRSAPVLSGLMENS